MEKAYIEPTKVPSVRRRAYLAAGSTALLGVFPGCSSSGRSDSSDTETVETARRTASAAPTATSEPTATDTDDESPAATDTEETASATATDDPVTVEFITPDDLREGATVFVAPDAQWELLLRAADTDGLVSEVFDPYPWYDTYALGQNSTLQFPHEKISSVRLDGTDYRFRGQSTTSAQQRQWYQTVSDPDPDSDPNSEEIVTLSSLDPPLRRAVERVLRQNATSASEAVSVARRVWIGLALKDKIVDTGDRYVRIRVRFRSTPEWPPYSLYLGFELSRTTAASDPVELKRLPLSDDQTNVLLTDHAPERRQAVVDSVGDRSFDVLTMSALWSVE